MMGGDGSRKVLLYTVIRRVMETVQRTGAHLDPGVPTIINWLPQMCGSCVQLQEAG